MTKAGHLRSITIDLDPDRDYLRAAAGFSAQVVKRGDLILLPVDAPFRRGQSEDRIATVFLEQAMQPALLAVQFPCSRQTAA